ncbi:MAG TPA: molybdopterin cofactor-binding domain-containing protein, partial [Vicinamibacterales bacterium]|nr:molybdopterin cofactor-binding domain-containing protein [Vicinamibacterales bacterium]
MTALTSISRRDLFKAGGALVVSFAVNRVLPDELLAQDTGLATKPIDPAEVDSFFAIHSDGRISLYMGKVDIGTGLRIAIAQMAAEELGVAAEQISVIDGDTGLCPDQGGTGGSTGLTRGGTEVRRAAATARQTLLALGAVRLNRPAGDLTIVNGQVRPVAGGPGVGIGALVGEQRLSVRVDANAPLRSPSTYIVVGSSIPRPDLPGKTTGTHTYAHDHRLPNMLHARVIRPPAMGARLLSVDESSVSAIPDVRVVRVESFLAIVSKDEWAAVRGAAVLKATWTESEGLPDQADLQNYTRTTALDRVETISSAGDVEAAGANGAAKKLSATYFWPFQSHASLGPSCAVADVRADGSSTIWCASQGPHGLRANLAKVFGLSREKMRVLFLDGSGSYGTNGGDHVAADAVLLSKTLGQPVRVQWSRQDELGWDPKGPQQLLDLEATLEPSGRITTWDTQMWLPIAAPGGRALLAADAANIAQEHGGGAGAITQNGEPPYQVANVRVRVHWRTDPVLALSNLRAPGKIANVFAVESFTDELAADAKIDPVAFRLSKLTDPRAIEVVTRVARALDWQPRPSPNPASRSKVLTGRGIAYMRYKQAENYVATAMDVAVDESTGRILVRRVVCAHDCGLVVNPDGLQNQIEGCIVQTLSRALHEEVKFNR